MPLQSTSGAASYDAFGGGVAAVPKYIEEYFSTFLYSGTGAAQTITNGIDLSTKGGLVWLKARNDTRNNWLYDTVRGKEYGLRSDLNFAENYSTNSITAFNNNGFSIGDSGNINTSGNNLVSWSIAKAPKFFDVVTYTGNGSGNRIITSSLGSPIGCIFIKRTDSTSNWATAHRKDGSAVATGLSLNTTAAALYPNSTNDTFDATGGFNAGYIVDSTGDGVNVNGATYVAYLFAHNAGGFGLTGTDNVISCGSFTTDGSGNATVSLGYEPQWLLSKGTSAGNDWFINDNMRGLSYSNFAFLNPNSSSAETNLSGDYLVPNATGFTAKGFSGSTTFIYIAIRRGPMKTPTSGTSVYETVTSSATAGTVLTTGFPVDLQMQAFRSTTGAHRFMDRLRGVSTNSTAGSISLNSTSDAAETSTGSYSLAWNNTGFQMTTAFESTSGVFWNFRRAPSFFDEVCYTGNGGINNVQNHSLADSIGMLIIKRRDSTGNWSVFVKESGGNYSYWNSSGTGTGQGLNGTGAPTGTNYSGYNSYLTSTTFNAAQIAGSNDINANGGTYVAYLFATCAGVSKVGSYTGNGSSQTINCGFTGGARFVMVKATSTTGNWIVADSARGIVAGNDPALYLNSTAAEVTGLDWIDADNSGFVVNETATIAANTNGVSYIFFAVA